MKKNSSFVVLAAVMAALLSFSSCSNGSKTSELYSVTIDAVANGTVIASKTSEIAEGETITLTITPEANYELDSISAGSSVTLEGTGNTRTFAMPAANVTVTAVFKEIVYIGTKKPNVAKAVGDIVFNDGSSMAYSDFDALDAATKTAKKTSAIALIFYKGTGLNSGDDTTTSRTLGVGLKHDTAGRAWCRKTSDTDYANARNLEIETICCPQDGAVGAYTFTGDKNGSDNLEQIAEFLTATDGVTDDTGTEENYPAFYFAKNYAAQTGSNITAGSEYATGWYLPTTAELFQIYACSADTENGFNVYAASQFLGDEFANSYYWSSSQYPKDSMPGSEVAAMQFTFSNGSIAYDAKQLSYSLVVIRAFN